MSNMALPTITATTPLAAPIATPIITRVDDLDFFHLCLKNGDLDAIKVPTF